MCLHKSEIIPLPSAVNHYTDSDTFTGSSTCPCHHYRYSRFSHTFSFPSLWYILIFISSAQKMLSIMSPGFAVLLAHFQTFLFLRFTLSLHCQDHSFQSYQWDLLLTRHLLCCVIWLWLINCEFQPQDSLFYWLCCCCLFRPKKCQDTECKCHILNQF